MSDFGTDLSALGALGGLSSRMVSGLDNLGEALLRRYQTPRGGLWYAPDYGRDVRSYLNRDIGPGDLYPIQAELADEAEQDERVLSAAVTITLTGPRSARMRVACVTAAGPFNLVLAVTAMKVQVLRDYDA